jgi:hypothetical protein
MIDKGAHFCRDQTVAGIHGVECARRRFTSWQYAAHLLVFAIPGTGLDRMFAAFDAASKHTAHMPAIDTIAAIAEQMASWFICWLG